MHILMSNSIGGQGYWAMEDNFSRYIMAGSRGRGGGGVQGIQGIQTPFWLRGHVQPIFEKIYIIMTLRGGGGGE